MAVELAEEKKVVVADTRQSPIFDRLARPMQKLRVSLTARCNFNCLYCKPKNAAKKYKVCKQRNLSFSQRLRLVKLLGNLGTSKIHLSGGEPLLYPRLADFIKAINCLGNFEDIAMTTNAHKLAAKAAELKASGLQRVNISIDALDSAIFAEMTGLKEVKAEECMQNIMRGIDTSLSLDMKVKLNAVILRDKNLDQVVPLTKFAMQKGIEIRFLEYMDVGNDNDWNISQLVPQSEIQKILAREFELGTLQRECKNDVAESAYAFTQNQQNLEKSRQKIGFISSISRPFCTHCSRLRLSADGLLAPCLFTNGKKDCLDLNVALNAGYDDASLQKIIIDFWQKRADRYSEVRFASETQKQNKLPMHKLGG